MTGGRARIHYRVELILIISGIVRDIPSDPAEDGTVKRFSVYALHQIAHRPDFALVFAVFPDLYRLRA